MFVTVSYSFAHQELLRLEAFHRYPTLDSCHYSPFHLPDRCARDLIRQTVSQVVNFSHGSAASSFALRIQRARYNRWANRAELPPKVFRLYSRVESPIQATGAFGWLQSVSNTCCSVMRPKIDQSLLVGPIATDGTQERSYTKSQSERRALRAQRYSF